MDLLLEYKVYSVEEVMPVTPSLSIDPSKLPVTVALPARVLKNVILSLPRSIQDMVLVYDRFVTVPFTTWPVTSHAVAQTDDTGRPAQSIMQPLLLNKCC